MYYGYYGKYEFNSSLDNGWHVDTGYTYGYASVMGSDTSKGYIQSFSHLTKSGLKRSIHYYASGTINTSWEMDENMTGLRIGIGRHEHDSKDDSYCRLTSGYLKRRVLNKNLRLRIHTANDGEDGNGNVATAPKDAAALTEKSGAYASMKPKVMVVPGSGGVNSKGKLYVGSKVSVALTATGSYKHYTGSALNAAVYVTRADNTIVPAKVEAGNNGEYYVTLVWDDMTKEDLDGEYTINVVMTRRQELELNLRPSVERKVDRNGEITQEIDTDKIGEAWDNFWKRGSEYITLWVSETTSKAPHFDKGKLKEIKISKTDWKTGDKNPLKILGKYDNVQFINFNRKKADRIAYNGKIYQGNEKITIAVDALAFPKLSFGYYQEEFMDKPNVMEASVNRVELYVDGDGDGKISGSYNNSTGYFVLDNGTDDELVQVLEEGSYDEVTFQPVSLTKGGFGEYFAKVYYTMTPRYLEVPKNITAQGYAQVLPAFITSRTKPEKIAQLTEDQQKYRYILSGTNKDGKRTSDNHIMYGEAATTMNYVDVPLGGDHSPLEQVGEDEYKWTPQYVGNLLYPFSNPRPIKIEHSLAGDGIDLGEFTFDETAGETVTTGAAKDCLNGYLGSFVADTNIALCVTEQKHTADELKADQATLQALSPESTVLTNRTASPNGSYNSEGADGNGGEGALDTSESGQPISEFDLDYNYNMGVSSENFQGLATVFTSKNTVNIMISLPVKSWSKKDGGQDAGKWKSSAFPDTVTEPTAGSMNQMKAYMSDLKNGSYDHIREQMKQGGYNQGKSGSMSSKSQSITLSFSAAFTLKYDTRDNAWYMQEFAFGIGGSYRFNYTVRLACCPAVYGFITVNPSINIGTGGTIVHTAVEGGKPIVSSAKEKVLQKGKSLVFSTAFVNMYLQFSGTVYVEALDSKDAEEPIEGTNKGLISSGGEEKIHVQFKQSKNSMSFDDLKTTKYVRITAVNDKATIKYLNTIESIQSKLLWSGVSIAPRMSVEAGGGIGVEGLKAELFARINLSANFIFGRQREDGTTEDAEIQSVGFGVSLAVRAVLLMMSWETDIIGIRTEYSGETDKWTGYWTLFGDEHQLEADGEEGGGLRMPRDVSATQTIYSSQPGSADQGGGEGPDQLMAYDADDPNVPFQLSGYNSSAEAIRLADGLDIGYDYRVVEANGVNYVIYTMGREGGRGMDTSMLAVSRLVMTAEGYGQNMDKTGADFGDGLGLINPLDWEEAEDSKGNIHNVAKAPADRSEKPYILVDLKKDGNGALVDDGTGDLEFDVKVVGNKIQVAWVSYAKEVPNPSSNSRRAFQNAVKNTVVKIASYDVTKKDGFTEAQTISDPEGGAAVYAPTVVNDGIIAFVKANHVSDARKQELVAQYTEKLKNAGYTPTGDDVRREIYRNRLMTFENMIDYKGESGSIYVYGTAEKKLVEVAEKHRSGAKGIIEPVDKLKGLEVAEGSLDVVYLAYTTWNENLDPNSPLDEHNAGLYLLNVLHMRGVIRAYMEQDLMDKFSSALNQHGWFDALALYEEGMRYDAADADDTSLLIVGQGGKVFNINFYADNRGNLSVGSLSATQFYGGSADEQRSAMAFGADGAGHLATVYTAKVDHTTNTGLYISRYDERNGTWGKGVLLAMRHMNVQEDSVKYGWSGEEADLAYLGRLEGYDGGAMDQFQFDNPQIALGNKGNESEKGSSADQTDEEAEAGVGNITEADDFSGSDTTLVVMTQGFMRYLKVEEEEGEEFVVPGATPPADAAFPEGMGIYAISYGVGNQSIAEGNLTFAREDFTAGANLSASLSFINSGDISIRGSEKNPITVRLSVSGEGISPTELASWQVTENVVPGREVALAGDFVLPMALPEKAEFAISVSEDENYAEDPYSATLSAVYVVDGKRELGFEESLAELSRQDNGRLTLDENGNAVINVDLFVGNRGFSNAAGVGLQFTYGVHDPALAEQVRELKGEEEDWNAIIYKPLDITMNTLEVGEEEALAPLGAGNESELTRGILTLGGIRTGYGRHVRGTITIPADKFAAFGLDGESAPAGSLKLGVEIFCAADERKADTFGVYTFAHDEYNATNNRFEATIEHTTAFVAPTQLILPAGMQLRLPISFSSTLGDQVPEISAAELRDSENAEQMLDYVSYEKGSYAKGLGRGTVILRGAREGSGYVRIQDARTNAYQDIAILFMEAGEGIYISNTTGLFTFKDESGRVCKTSGDSWQFKQSQTGTGMHADGKPGVSFSFVTEAETIELTLNGEVFVESDNLDYRRGTITGSGETGWFTFGTNPEHTPHTVTITVKGAGTDGIWANLYQLSEYYDGDKFDPAAFLQGGAISLLWDSHFPEHGSLGKGQVYDARLIVLTDCAYAYHTIENGVFEVLESKELSGHSKVETIRFYKNGIFSMEVENEKHVRSKATLNVDWWDESAEKTEALQSGSPALATYEEKYPELTLNAMGAEGDDEVVETKWMSAEWDAKARGIRVSIGENAPMEVMNAYVAQVGQIFMGSENSFTVPGIEMADTAYLTPTPIARGDSALIPIKDEGLYTVLVRADAAGQGDSSQEYEIVDENGSAEEENGGDALYYNYAFVSTGTGDYLSFHSGEAYHGENMVQYLESDRLTFSAVNDGETLYLLKGGKYTFGAGVTVTPAAKNAVTQNMRSGKLTVNRSSLITLQEGTRKKEVLLRAVSPTRKTITLTSRKNSFSLAEMFTGVEGLLPDVDPATGLFAVKVKNDKSGILSFGEMPKPGKGYVTLGDFTVGSTGNKGSATITAVFGGVAYSANVKSAGFPTLEDVSGELVQGLETADAAGNRVLTFDSVEDGDTLLLVKDGKYALEAGVTIAPIGNEYRNAVKVTENKKTGIRKLTVSKEAPVTLTKLVQTESGRRRTVGKTILINLLNVRKKDITLAAGGSCSLADLFPDLAELLPDVTDQDAYGGYAISVTDKNGILFLDGSAFPAVKEKGQQRLSDFRIARFTKKGSATVAVTFGGKVFKATVRCK